MGLQSIMRAKRIILLAFGERKQEAIERLVNGSKLKHYLPLFYKRIRM